MQLATRQFQSKLIFSRRIKMADEKKKMRFNPVCDVILLREVVARQPDDKASWEEAVASINAAMHLVNVNQSISVQAAKFRLRTLVDAHQKDEMASLRA